MSLNRSLNVLPTVSVSTSVPAMKATPRTMAIDVLTRRILCPSKPLTVTLNMRCSLTRPSGRQRRRTAILAAAVDAAGRGRSFRGDL